MTARTLERVWNQRSDGWHHQVHDSPVLRALRDEVAAVADVQPDEVAVDLGCGTGFLTLAVAEHAGEVIGVDVSPAMTERLSDEAEARGIGNVQLAVADVASFDLPDNSVDAVVSLYALHHLSDPDKRALATRIARWLRPGGRVVVGDMMVGRGGSRRDRQILWAKARTLARKGPGGLWRIAKNLVRFGARVGQEQPASPEFWTEAMRDAGLSDVRFQPFHQEAGIVVASGD